MHSTPLPASFSDYDSRVSEHASLIGLAMGELRDSTHLVQLIATVDRGEVPPDAVGVDGKPILATALYGWWRWGQGKDWPNPMPKDLARFVPGQPWDGHGLCRPFEHLAAALISSGVELFPAGPHELTSLERAIEVGASATAVSLIHAPGCPSLMGHPKSPELLVSALSREDTAVVRMLLNKGVDPNALVGPSRVPAWFSARSPLHLEWLIESGADVSLTTPEGKSAPECWSLEGNIDARGLKDMGRLLSTADPAASVDSHVAAAFASVETLRVGSTKSWLSQDDSALTHAMPVPGMPEDTETLAQKMIRLFLVEHPPKKEARARQDWRLKSPPMGLLKLFIQHPKTPEPDRAAVALLAGIMGQVLGPKETAAKKVWESMRQEVDQVLSRPGNLSAAWETLGEVLRRMSDGALFLGYTQPSTQARGSIERPRLASSVLVELHKALGHGDKLADPVCFSRALIAPGIHLARTVNRDLAKIVETPLVDPLQQYPRPTREEHKRRKDALGVDPKFSLGVLVGLVMRGGTANKEVLEGWIASSDCLGTSPWCSQAVDVIDAASKAGHLPNLLSGVGSSWQARVLSDVLPSSAPARPKVRI